MMLGRVNLHIRGYAYVQPDNVTDMWVWIHPDLVSCLSLGHGCDVFYLPRKTESRWEAVEIDTDLCKCVLSPSLWQNGEVIRVFPEHCFIQPDLGPPNVLCMPGATEPEYAPYVGQQVEFRAGPSGKKASHYLQAIHLREKPEQRPPLHPGPPEPASVDYEHARQCVCAACISLSARAKRHSNGEWIRGIWIDYIDL